MLNGHEAPVHSHGHKIPAVIMRPFPLKQEAFAAISDCHINLEHNEVSSEIPAAMCELDTEAFVPQRRESQRGATWR